jgi:hypothetical protein
MSANVVQLPKRVERDLEPVQFEFRTLDIAKALGGSGVLQGPPDRPGWRWYRCRCPYAAAVCASPTTATAMTTSMLTAPTAARRQRWSRNWSG